MDILSKHNVIMPQSFSTPEGTYIFYDVFYKNNKLYITIPNINKDNKTIFEKELSILYNNKKLILDEFITGTRNGECCIAIYNCIDDSNIGVFIVKYLNLIKKYNLKHIRTNETNDKFLSMTTICKHDFKLFNKFYKYYCQLGVDHFFIYYNGDITDDIINTFLSKDKKNKVTLIYWPFIYRYNGTLPAQSTQINNCLYKFGKDNYRYMLFIDLDEYIFTPGESLIDTLKVSNTSYLKICNQWANSKLDYSSKLPDTFNVDKIISTRPKSILKTSDIKIAGIHGPGKCHMNQLKPLVKFSMFHFSNWSGKKRHMKTPFKINLSNQKNNKNYYSEYTNKTYLE